MLNCVFLLIYRRKTGSLRGQQFQRFFEKFVTASVGRLRRKRGIGFQPVISMARQAGSLSHVEIIARQQQTHRLLV